MDTEMATVLRGRAKVALTRTKNFIEKDDQTFDKKDVCNKLEKLELIYTELDKADATLRIESSEKEEFERKYYETKAKLQNILENLSVRTNVYNDNSDVFENVSNMKSSNFKLPKINIERFPDFIWPNGEKTHQKQSISLETKLAILDRLGKGERSTAIGKHFNLGESTVRAIKKNEAAIRKSVISGTRLSTKFASYRRDVLLERTERAIAIWIEEQVQRRIPVSGYLIQEKALQFYKSMKQSEPSTSTSLAGKEFSASKGWLTGFLKRNALHNIKITGESATADEGAPKIFPEELAKIIEDGDYSADQVFNADEIGLYWKKLPNRTYIAKDEKTASGHKASKDRVTLLFCSNASGDRMLKPLLINKSLRPRALKASHPQLEHPNVQLVFHPPNTTSLIQPLDQGIIATFKKYYIKTTYKFILNKLENESLTVKDVWKQFSIFDCLIHVASASAQIRPRTLNACWKKIWTACVTDNTTTQTSTLSDEIINLAHEIGGDGFNTFSHDDIDELLVDDVLSDNDIIDLTLDLTVDGVVGLEGDNDEEEKSTPPHWKINSRRSSTLQ
ncbi:tigger transposable element-derived protein 1 [Trichonephila clavipes]|nr:tigger transposable element-derived protein 1 [Trichonephila clavipes]